MPNDHNMTFKSISLIGFFFAVFLFLMGPLSSHANEAPSDTSHLIASTGKINLNTATAEQIAGALKGIGMKKAEAIVQYREAYGPFANIQELVEVKGIGTSTLEKNADLITVE